MLGAGGVAWNRPGRASDLGPVGVEPKDARLPTLIEALRQLRLRNHHPRRAVAQHEFQPLGGILRVERHERGPRLEDPQYPDDEVERPLDAQGDERLRADPKRAQVLRQQVGPRI